MATSLLTDVLTGAILPMSPNEQQIKRKEVQNRAARAHLVFFTLKGYQMGNSRPKNMMTEYKKFSLAMRLARTEQQISLRELAEKLGTTKQVLSRYETGRNEPKLSTAAAIAKALGLKLSEMIGD